MGHNSPMDDFDLIIFDCDGTLTDSEYVNNKAVLDVAHEEGLTHYDLDYAYKHWLGTTLGGIVLAIQMETGKILPENFAMRCVKRGMELADGFLNPVANALELVEASSKKFKICVASNGEQSSVVRSLEKTGFLSFFKPEWVFTKSLVRNPKPAPDLFLFAAAQMGAEADRCVVIEDSTTGVTAGVAAGMKTWGFTGSSHDPQKAALNLESAGAHAIFPSLIHIKDRLGL
ncbi:MAG: HAD family hydrolase [Micavibrio aeruginosavorus]|uniref:HAD family hydrolase n=1 Tax=Micavibrio aeruginosavorus TaxID=349221 RepID=A0A2W5PSS8_9BACT|nr:MAG: HAD family hydrolase [Micavibrio aeruginosavorus]